METIDNKLEIDITRCSICFMDKLDFGDIFQFFTDGYKFVFLGRTPDGRFCYRRFEMRSKRKYYCRRSRTVFCIDAYGGLFIANGELFIDYQTALKCVTRL